MIKIVFWVVLVALTLVGCANAIPGEAVKTDSLDYRVDRAGSKFNREPVMLNVDLPVEKLVIVSGQRRQEFEVEIATTDAQRKIGLMNRSSLDERRGMLFLFDRTGYVNFWMKDTLISLDMLFIDDKGFIKHIVHEAKSCPSAGADSCPLYSSEEPVKYVLELKGGSAKKFGIGIGDKATWL